MQNIVTVIPTQTMLLSPHRVTLPAGQDHTLPEEKTRDGPLARFYFV